MVYLRNAEWELIDNFRSLTKTGQKLVFAYSEKMANSPAIPCSLEYGEINTAQNMVVMSQMEHVLIDNFRKCNDDGRCSNIIACVESVTKGHRNPEYITEKEWLILNKFRKATVYGQARIIQTVCNVESDSESSKSVKQHVEQQPIYCISKIIDFPQVRRNS